MAKTRKRARKMTSNPEQTVLEFHSGSTGDVLDLAAALTAVNRKQYHQTKSMRPLLYHVRAQAISLGTNAPPIKFATAPNTWTTKNAVVLLGKMFKQQLKNNNIRVGQLPTYGRELRLGLATGVGYSHGAGSDGFAGSATISALEPKDQGGTDVFSDYTNSDGTSVSYESSNDLTLISVPETTADGEPETVVPSLLGTTNHDNNDLAVIPDYLDSRRNRHDHTEVDSDFPSDTNILMRIGSSSEEHYDDVVDALEETGDQRPYDEVVANRYMPQGGLMAIGDYCSFVAPLGLVKLDSAADCKFYITVSAITEM